MNYDCTIYIDEAGDLGIGRGTRWFVLSAVIINVCDEPKIRNIMNSVKHRLNIHDIHFRTLRNFEQKTSVINELANGNFEYLNVIIDTSQSQPYGLTTGSAGGLDEPLRGIFRYRL